MSNKSLCSYQINYTSKTNAIGFCMFFLHFQIRLLNLGSEGYLTRSNTPSMIIYINSAIYSQLFPPYKGQAILDFTLV